jgi:tetratricopeptide (TPR) repeat protein
MNSHTLISLVLVVCSVGTSLQTAKNPPTQASKLELSEHQGDTTRRQRLVARIQDLAYSASGLKDVAIKSRSLAGLAEVLWDADQGAARDLYVRSYSLLESASMSSSSNRTRPIENSADLEELRSSIVASLAHRDEALAATLADSTYDSITPSSRGEADGSLYLRVAHGLVEQNPQLAVEFAQRALRNNEWRDIVWLLFKLERYDQNVADSVFLDAIASAASQANVDGNDLLTLGTYLFTTPADDCPPDAIQLVLVGNLSVVNIWKTRPGRSERVMRAYLDFASGILSCRIFDASQKQLYYIAARQLVPKAQEFSPSILPQLNLVMSALAPSIPAFLLEESTYENFARVQSIGAPNAFEHEVVAEGARHDAKCLSLMYSSWRQGDFDRAQSIVNRIKGTALRTQLAQMVRYGKAAKALDSGDVFVAVSIARTLPDAVETAILWLSLASSYCEDGMPERALKALRTATNAARSSGDIRQPLILLGAVARLSSLDAVTTNRTLSEAISGFNSNYTAGPLRIKWSQRAQANGVWRDFTLKVKGVDNSVWTLLKVIALQDTNLVTRIILEVKNEEVVGAGLVALGTAAKRSLWDVD